MNLVKLFFNAIAAWALGLAFIAATLYFANDGADFTVTDLSGFGVMAVVASGILMLLLYLPSLYWLKRRRGASGRGSSSSCSPVFFVTCRYSFFS